MIFKKIMLLAFTCVFSASCLGSLQENDERLSKEQVEKRWETGDTNDYCERFDWYGDGECDVFCITADSDCAAQCDSVPTCPEDSIEVSMCEGHPNCQELQACGTTLFCEACELEIDKIQWHSVESICPENHFPLSTCDSVDLPCIEIASACGRPIYCNPIPLVECFAPVCDKGDIEVERCKLDDPTCKNVFSCTKTASCIPDMVCDEAAECKNDEIRYGSREDCEANDNACRQHYFCNDIVWCGGTDGCQIPMCGDKKSVLECSNSETCFEEFGCGQRALCEG